MIKGGSCSNPSRQTGLPRSQMSAACSSRLKNRNALELATCQLVEPILGGHRRTALAGQLDLRDDQRMLYGSLEEEKRADDAVDTFAKGEVNKDSVSAFAITPVSSRVDAARRARRE